MVHGGLFHTNTFRLGGRRFLLRRVAFPRNPSPEWFVVDLFQHTEQAAADRNDLTFALARALHQGRFDADRLRMMAREYGSKDTQSRVTTALRVPARQRSRAVHQDDRHAVWGRRSSERHDD